MTYKAYNRKSFFTADIVASARSLEALKMQLQAKRVNWTDIYSDDASYHELSPRGQAQIRLAQRGVKL
jgi:hypothetical protein